MKTLRNWLLLAGLYGTFFGAQSVAPAQSNLVLLVSQTGDYIGSGGSYASTNLDDFSAGGVGGYAVFVSAFGYYVLAEGVNFGALTVGDYPNAARFATEDSPELAISGNGRGCNVDCGSFHIYELETNSAGEPTRLWMTFTQYCECGSAALTGEVRYNSQLAPSLPMTPRILRVPQDYSTIQAGIDAANPFVQDTVLVTNGIYYENLDFRGKAVTVTSVNGPQATIIDGNASGAVVNFASGENTNSLLAGFTLTNGTSGVSVSSSAPTISSNVIVNSGIGVDAYFGSPIIENNSISGGSSGVYLQGAGNAVIQFNSIQKNGSGISMWSSGLPNIVGNLIQDNQGTGIGMVNYCDANIIQNVIMNNAGDGIAGGIGGSRGPWIINNTIVGNTGNGIGELTAAPLSGKVVNNIVIGSPALSINTYPGFADEPPVLQFNDFYSPTGAVYSGGVITELNGIDGNISADPFFACGPTGDCHLLAGSPCIDAGTNDLSDLPSLDFDGNPRILAGISNNVPTVDMGAYEFNPLYPPVPCMFVDCQTDLVVYTAAGQNSAVVTFPTPTGTSVATITCSPPSGSAFYAGTNVVTCTATYGTNSASCTFNVIVVVAPTITQQPHNLEVSAGQSFTLSVGVSGTPPMNYQWNFQGQPLYGQNASTLTISNAQSASDGVYSVLVYNDAGATNGSLARVRVLPAKPVIVGQPVSITTPASFGSGFTVAAIGSQPLSYQWYYDSHAISGATGAQFNLDNPQVANAGNYFVVVSNFSGAVTSRIVRLAVTPAKPYFVVQPFSATWFYGGTATLPSLAQGSEPIHYQWYFNGRALPGQINPSLKISKLTRLSAGNYFVVAMNYYGRATSTGAQMTVDVPPQMTRGLSNQIVNAGQNVTLSVSATGDLPLSFSWTFNGSPISWTNPALNLTNIQPPQTGYYVVTISNVYGVISSQAKISFLGPAARLAAWGDNTGGQIDVPAGLSNIVAAAGGDLHTIALRTNGKLAAWGSNSDGQTNIPPHLPSIVSIAAGASHNLAIGADGSLFAWGNNAAGQCNIPYSSISQPLSISAGDEHSLSLLANGTVAVWGDDTYGQTQVPDVLTPQYGWPWWGIFWPNPNWMPASAIAAGRNHNLAVLTNGVVVAWGDNSGGQCNVPADLTNAVAVAGGYLHSVALRTDGTVLAWGDNTYGQTNVPADLTNVIAVTAGDFNTLALRADGLAVAWGDNSYGQNSVPASVTNVVGIASGYYHSLALIPPKTTLLPVRNHPIR